MASRGAGSTSRGAGFGAATSGSTALVLVGASSAVGGVPALSERSGSLGGFSASTGPSDRLAPLGRLGDGLGELLGLGLRLGLGDKVASGDDGLAGAEGFEGAQALILRLNRLRIKPIRCDFAQTIRVLGCRFIKSLQLETKRINSRSIAQSR